MLSTFEETCVELEDSGLRLRLRMDLIQVCDKYLRNLHVNK